MKNIKELANNYFEEIKQVRRELHKTPEIAFNLHRTREIISNALEGYGYKPEYPAGSGIITVIGNSDGGKTVLLRADMDGLNIPEETELEFASINGCMHACGHDIHSAILLGVAKILKEFENEINGKIVLLFQPAEETLSGAKTMLESGIIEHFKPDLAISLHVLPDNNFKEGSIIIPPAGIISPAACLFEIEVKGKGAHGAMPENSIDPIIIASSIVLSLQEIIARELPSASDGRLTFGKFASGDAANIIPNSALLCGSFRSTNQFEMDYIKKRTKEISSLIAESFRGEGKFKIVSECPSLKIDKGLREFCLKTLENTFDKELIINNLQSGSSSGSEDFAYFTQVMPSLFLSLVASSNGYPLHHPKLIINEGCIKNGITAIAEISLSAVNGKNYQRKAY